MRLTITVGGTWVSHKAAQGMLCLLLALPGLTSAEPTTTLQTYDWGLPDWVPPPTVPENNPMTREKVQLGRHLFFDPRLSANGQMSCASCHDPGKAFTDSRPLSVGVTGELSHHHSMMLANVAYMPVLTWANPQLSSLEIQTLIPLFGEHPVEMGMAGREQELFARIQADPRYQTLFREAFPDIAASGSNEALFSLSTLTKALASFQRSLLSFDSAFDRYQYGGDRTALSESAQRGRDLFFGERMECYHCHGGLNFSDNVRHSRLPFPELGFHNTGLYNVDGRGAYPVTAAGTVTVTGESRDQGRFRTPSLRNVAVTAPYMHDGSMASLEQVIREHYALGGRSIQRGEGPNPLRSEFMVGFELTDEELADVIAFLEALTDHTFLNNPAHRDPWPQAE